MRRSDSAGAVVLLSFALFVCYQAGRYPFGTLGKFGPGFLPLYLGILLAALAVIILIRALFAAAETGPPPWEGITARKVLRVVSVLLCTAAYTFFLNKLGFLVATFLFTLILLKIAESYSWLASVLIAGIASAGNFLIFQVWLQGQFPKGWLGI